MKKIFGLVAAFLLTISFTTQSTSHANDIKNHMMATELTYWSNLNVIRPDAKGNFNPDSAVTRGEFASYITRALNLPASTTGKTFKDLTSGTELTKEIEAAAAVGIINGYTDDTFRPNEKITRQHMAALLQRTLNYAKVPQTAAPLTFKDNNIIEKEFHAAIAVNVHYNIIRGNLNANGLYFDPKGSATIAHAAAFLYRMNATIQQYGELPNGVDQPTTPVIPPDVDLNSYYVGTISNGKLEKKPTIYPTFEQAEIAQKAISNSVILKGDKIIKMESGLAYASNTTNGTTTIYSDANFKSQLTYFVAGTELKYYSSNDKYAIVQVADTKGYVKIDDVSLTPNSLIKGQGVYTKVEGMLTHRIYNHLKNSYDGAYTNGPAPAFMKAGVNYYSLDGVNFYSDNLFTKKVGTSYPYFQFASVRQHTNYSAEELDELIMTLLKDRFATGYTKYTNILTDSRLLGMGKLLKDIETQYNVNALFILSAAIHESDYGISNNAIQKNNIFGIKVYDADPTKGSVFTTRDEGVIAFVNEYMNLKYIPQTGAYSKGAVPGNKTAGFNVSYASDPFWGSKIAGHMYRIDAQFGKKDYNTSKLAFVISGGSLVNTRADATTNSDKVFTFKAKYVGESNAYGYPVVIVDEKKGTDGYVWYKILSDNNPPSRYVWVRSDLVKQIPTN